MLTFLHYVRDDRGMPDGIELAAAWERVGAGFEGVSGDSYRSGGWQEPQTGARLLIDIGLPPLDQEAGNDDKHYDGWCQVPLAVHIPLAGPHWLAVEAIACCQRVLELIPGLAVLDTEDPRPSEEVEPGVLDRLAALGSWERQMAAQIQGRKDLPRMQRRESVALWRYRKQRPISGGSADDTIWPEALVLTSECKAEGAAFWEDPDLPLALPPVPLLVVRRGHETGVLPTDELRTAAGELDELMGGAVLVRPSQAVQELFHKAHLLPLQGYRACADLDWTDLEETVVPT